MVHSYYAVFAPHIYSVCSYSKHLQETTALGISSRVFPPTGVRFPTPTAANRNYNWACPIGSQVISHSPVEFHGTDTDLTENDGCGLFSGENILPALVWLVALLYLCNLH